MSLTIQWIVEFSHGQFALADADMAGDPGDLGSDAALSNRVVPSDYQTEFSILTARYGSYVKVLLDVVDAAPPQDYSAWDHVAECNLNAPSGKLQLWTTAGNTVFSADTRKPEDAEICVPPALYRVRILFAHLASTHKRISDSGDESSPLYNGDDALPSDAELDEMDYYHLILWPLATSEVTILKQYERDR